MATRNKPVKTAEAAPVAAKKAPKFAGKPAADDTVATAAPAKAAKNKPAPAVEKTESSGRRGRAPLDVKVTFNAEAAEGVKKGFFVDFTKEAGALHKASRGKGFQTSELFAKFPDAPRPKLMDCYYAATKRGILSAA